MDPFLLSLAVALGSGISTIAGTLLNKGVVEPALEPATEKLKHQVQSGFKAREKGESLASAVLSAIEDASGQEGESPAIEYARRIRLHEIVEPGHESLRNQVTSLVYLASSDDPGLVPDACLEGK